MSTQKMGYDEFAPEKNYVEQLNCSKTTKRLLMENCVEVYLQHHPEMKGTKIKQGHMIRQVVEYYLNE